MKKLIFLLCLCPFLVFANDKTPSKIKEVTIFLNGAEITRSANCHLVSGFTELSLTGLSPKIDENSIQISGLKSASILSITYDIDYLEETKGNPEVVGLENSIKSLELETAMLKNHILGLNEEENVLTTNRLISSDVQQYDIEKVKQASTYYRERITAIKNEILKTNLEINDLHVDLRNTRDQLQELNGTPVKPKGKINLKLDSKIALDLALTISYAVQDAGWVPTYDIERKDKYALKTHL